VMIEAMACGTPVIEFRRGAVPEVVHEGESGFIVDNEDEAVGAIRRLGDLDRRRVRDAFERRFTAARISVQCMKVYDSLAM
jgi:glycosyltransferase involved in cell wall biosynthesis